MAKKRKKAKRTTRKSASKRSKRKAPKKRKAARTRSRHIPLAILKKRLAKLDRIVKARS